MFTAVVVLPTPPFWLATHITRRWGGRGIVISPLGFRISTARFASWASGGSSVSRETCVSVTATPVSGAVSGMAIGWDVAGPPLGFGSGSEAFLGPAG